jgi:hypothetical protein
MDRNTAERYADAYGLTADDVMKGWQSLPAAVQPVIATAFRTSMAPRDADAYRLYEQGMESWGEFVAQTLNDAEAVIA